jgi:SAM-dependent methyltransferase
MPNNSPLSSFKQTFLYRRLRQLKYKWLQKKYAKNSYSGSFDWDWTVINYNRVALVNLLIAKKADCAYLEIGCDTNSVFNAVPILDKVGVDPQNGGNIRKTSDEFFITNSTFFDVIFIDGLHTYDQVRRDVINAIRFLKPDGWIAVHDMLPRNWIEEHVPMVSDDDWTGDVWKVAFELSKTDGVDFRILKIDHGIAVLRLTKDRPVLADLRNELSDKKFSYLYENISALPLAEWSDAYAWLNN